MGGRTIASQSPHIGDEIIENVVSYGRADPEAVLTFMAERGFSHQVGSAQDANREGTVGGQRAEEFIMEPRHGFLVAEPSHRGAAARPTGCNFDCGRSPESGPWAA